MNHITSVKATISSNATILRACAGLVAHLCRYGRLGGLRGASGRIRRVLGFWLGYRLWWRARVGRRVPCRLNVLIVHRFRTRLQIIDGNPFVELPTSVLKRVFVESGRDKSPIPVHGSINGKPYRQTLVKFRGEWRLYVNMEMLKDSPRRVGESIEVDVAFDPVDRAVAAHPKFAAALADNADAEAAFEALPPSRQREILRYLSSLKRDDSVERNVDRAIKFLLGDGRFVGRDSP